MFKRRYRCILCNKYWSKSYIAHSHLGIGICKLCLSEARTGGDRSFQSRPPVDYVLSPFYYDGYMRKAVKRYKFSGQKAYGILFGRMLGTELANHPFLKEYDYIIPVPLHGKRLCERGYNQSELLSMGLAEGIGKPFLIDVLFRVCETKQQSGLGSVNRVDNVKDAFYAPEGIVCGKKIILVDDIFTTGETLRACANALKNAGAERIAGVALCRPHFEEKTNIYR